MLDASFQGNLLNNNMLLETDYSKLKCMWMEKGRRLKGTGSISLEPIRQNWLNFQILLRGCAVNEGHPGGGDDDADTVERGGFFQLLLWVRSTCQGFSPLTNYTIHRFNPRIAGLGWLAARLPRLSIIKRHAHTTTATVYHGRGIDRPASANRRNEREFMGRRCWQCFPNAICT